jgi:hypothetical protein
MLSTPLLALLLALMPALAHGQHPERPDTPEADSLEAFRTRMFALPVLLKAPAPLSKYTLVWMEHNSGYAISIQAVNDSTRLSEWGENLRQLSAVAHPTFYGDRYALITVDIPVSMMDLTLYYYERR